MTRCLLMVVMSFASVAPAQDALDSPYDEVVELPLDGAEAVPPPTDVPSPPIVADDGQSAVASDPARAEGDVPSGGTDYELARANAERAIATQPVAEVPETVPPSPSVTAAPAATAPPAPVAPSAAPSASEGMAQPAFAVAVGEPERSSAQRTTARQEEVWAFRPAPSAPVHEAAPVASTRAKPAFSHSASTECDPSCEPATKREDPVERWRDNPRRVQHTVFGERRHTRGLGAVAGVAYQPGVAGGPAGGALQLAARLGSGFRIGFESRGLWGAAGPTEARLVSSGLLLGATFNTRQWVHPTLDVVFGAGLVRDARGEVVGAVGTTVVRGGAELNVAKNVRLGATLGWAGVTSPEPVIRHDLSGLEAGVALRFGWF